MKPTLSIIIPTYNEAERIENTIHTFQNYLKNESYSTEIVIADDGSTDDTFKQVEKLQLIYPNIHWVACETNKGKGQAVRTGMLAATGKIRLFMDADGATPPEALPQILAPLLNNTSDISIASRYLTNSKMLAKQPLYRIVWSRVANFFVQKMILPGIVDPNCGFKAFTENAAIQLFTKSTINEWSFDLEILGMARKVGFQIAEIPVDWTHDERSKGKLSQLPLEIYNVFKIKKQLKSIS